MILSIIASLALSPSCTDLKALTIPNVTITSAGSVPAGPFTPPGLRNPITLPSFCRVEATARPTADSEIRFEVWIPPTAAWNGKFQGVGNGGYAGAIFFPAMAAPLSSRDARARPHNGDK